MKLALAGAATAAALSSFVVAIMLPRNDIAGGVRSWQIGGVGGSDVHQPRRSVAVLHRWVCDQYSCRSRPEHTCAWR
ncbi:MAG: hypothetical protein ACK5MR_12325 [Cumulibacter sp.]